MSHYPVEVVERVIVNLAMKEDPIAAYDLIFDTPELSQEMESGNLTAPEMLCRIIWRANDAK